MKAVVLTRLLGMELREVPDPVIESPHDVLLRVTRVGVCGSDVHYHKTGRIGSQVVQYPFRVGHESAGIVEAVGSAVTRVRVGDKVAIDPAMPCGECDQCLCGRPHTCRKLRFLGCPGQAEGSLCEKLVMPEGSLFPIAAESTLDHGALSEPLAIGVYATRLAGELRGKKVGILGFGPIGMSVLLPALHKGAGPVYVTDKIDARLDMAWRMGAAWTGNPVKEDVVAAVREREPLLLDYVFECCGEQEALDNAIDLLAPGGKLLLIGIPEVDRVSFPIDLLRRKEICIQNVRRQNECVEETLELIASGALPADAMVTHRFPLERTPDAFDLVMNYRDGVMKAMIEIGGP
mgnify:CR=1 FL=1